MSKNYEVTDIVQIGSSTLVHTKSSERDTASCKSIVNTQMSFEPHEALKTLTGRSQQKNNQDIKKKKIFFLQQNK